MLSNVLVPFARKLIQQLGRWPSLELAMHRLLHQRRALAVRRRHLTSCADTVAGTLPQRFRSSSYSWTVVRVAAGNVFAYTDVMDSSFQIFPYCSKRIPT